MHEDLKLAGALVAGSPRTLKTLRNRFRDELDMALEHCRMAVEIGLESDEYSEGVLRSAAESLLNSFPVSRPDGSLDPHVSRVLGHRDFALALLLRRNVEDAWRVFVQRFGNYIRSLYIRDGRSYDEAQKQLEELMEILRSDESGIRPIVGYKGTVDLTNWLYCFVRSREKSQRAFSPVVESEQKHVAAHQLPLVLHEDELRDHTRVEFAQAWARLSDSDRDLMKSLSFGRLPGDLRPDGTTELSAVMGPRQLAEKHNNLVKQLSQDLRKRVVSHYRGLVSAVVVEEAIIDVITGELVQKLTPIVGSLEGEKEAGA